MDEATLIKICELRVAGLTFREIGERVGMRPGEVWKIWQPLVRAAVRELERAK